MLLLGGRTASAGACCNEKKMAPSMMTRVKGGIFSAISAVFVALLLVALTSQNIPIKHTTPFVYYIRYGILIVSVSRDLEVQRELKRGRSRLRALESPTPFLKLCFFPLMFLTRWRLCAHGRLTSLGLIR